MASFFSGFAAPPDEEADDKEDAKNGNDVQMDCYPPSVFEFRPNSVIQAHLRSEHLESLDSVSTMATSTSDCLPMDTYGAAEDSSPKMAINFDDEDTINGHESSSNLRNPSGPATMSANLSSYACPECTYIANKKYQLKYAILTLPQVYSH